MRCPSCSATNPDASRFCSSCGSLLDPSSGPTEMATTPLSPSPPVQTPRQDPPAGTSRRRLSADRERFVPGMLLAERYRIVALVGKGGMGEVYRADDLKLGQTVALKFLPVSLSGNEEALKRFHAEVRLARQISHPNVCRVFDVGESDGRVFFTMEYVDGEDLATLLRRIGRLPADKGLEIARQLCAGLAAAHEYGVLHRDLKPANIMLDGRGKVRITDFGLAAFAEDIAAEEIRSGTPAYMAPEQTAGLEVTVKSDLYSLGLVLFEVFTGKRATDTVTPGDLHRSPSRSSSSPTSSREPALDPVVERVILRCLEKNPEKRPASALQVAAALPGGDPLAAALAAGETPSPEMVAAAGETSGLAPRVALTCFGAVILGVILLAAVIIKENGLERIHPENPPEVLAKKSREIISSLGYPGQPSDKADGFDYDTDFLAYLAKDHSQHPQWDRVLSEQPPVLLYWFRQSPSEMSPDSFWGPSLTPNVVTFSDPAPILSGMINIQLDPEGRLLYFQAIPPEKEANPAQTSGSPDWLPLFAAAGLNLPEFHSAEPVWDSLASADTRAAWVGVWPGSGRPLHIEAGARRGKPVFFALTGPWTKPKRMNQAEQTSAGKAGQIIGLSVAFLVFAAGLLLGYRNYSRGKGDRQGALRLASIIFVLELSVCVFRSHFVPTMDTLGLVIFGLSTALFVSAVVWVFYLALEPYVRRIWPQTIISLSRLVS